MPVFADASMRGSLASRPAAGPLVNAGRLYYDTTNGILYRDSGSAWESIQGANPYAPSVPTVASLTRLNSGTYLVTDTVNGIHWAGTGTGGVTLDGLMASVTAGADYTLTVGFSGVNWWGQQDKIGILLQSANVSGTVKQILLGHYLTLNSGVYMQLQANTFTNGATPVSYSAPTTDLANVYTMQPRLWFRVVANSSGRSYQVSVNGLDFYPVGSSTRTDQFTEVAVGFGLYAANSVSRANFDVFSWNLA